MKLARPFIRLPLSFDAARLAREAVQLKPAAWKQHPLGLKGNSAVALISRAGGDNDEFGGRMAATRHLDLCPYHQQVMASFGEVLARSRLMKLNAGCEVQYHVDFNYHWYTRVRIHIPITTNPAVVFYCGNEKVHMQAGECWIFDNWRRHNVINSGMEERIHLVIDLSGSSRFWRMVRQALQTDTGKGSGGDGKQFKFVAYEPGKQVDILTENYNISPVMAPGEIDALVTELLREFENHPANDPALVERYRLALSDFASDWREIWHRYGMDEQGLPHYRRLVERVKSELHPNRRALLISANDVGVNPVIVQRILRAALAPDVYAEWGTEFNSVPLKGGKT